MAHQSPIGNPFILMLNPEVVLAAIERSERLGKLDRRLCRPLDRPDAGGGAGAGDEGALQEDGDADARPGQD